MSQNYEELHPPMKALFPLDQPGLDIGLYGVIHAKSAESEVGVANTATSSGGPE